MADFYQAMCDEEAIVCRYAELEWTDDVRGFECARCGRVLIQHYIANCQHKFCSNCHKLMGDGSQRWKCPQCYHFITTIERQDFAFREQVYQLGVHCPNRKYGCDHTCPLKELRKHMNGCEHTRESALPVLYEGHRSPQMLAELVELRTEVREMRQMMMEMEKRWNDRELEREKDLVDVNSRMDEISSKLEVETTKINKQNSELKNEILLVAEENKSQILKLDVKSDVLMDMLEKKEKNHQIKIENMKKQIKNQEENLKIMNQSMRALETELKESNLKMLENVDKLKADTENFVKEKIEQVEGEMRHSDRLLESKLKEQVLIVNEKMEDDVLQINVKLTTVEETVETLKTDVSKCLPQNKTKKSTTTQV